jgi:tryptophan synthase alpha chain
MTERSLSTCPDAETRTYSYWLSSLPEKGGEIFSKKKEEKMKHRLMTHMVAYYPDGDRSMEVAAAMIDGGSTYLEIQFPFSDPTADGPAIQTACTQALQNGFKIRLGFELVSAIRTKSDIPIFIMCYGNTLFHHGIEAFIDCCAQLGVQGLIVPDLPFDYDEDLFHLSEKHGIDAVPVVAPTIVPQRLESILRTGPRFLYAALRKGITGKVTEIGDDNIGFIRRISTAAGKGEIRILAGFGISHREQIDLLAPHVHASIVGSAFVRTIMENEEGDVYAAVKLKMEELI